MHGPTCFCVHTCTIRKRIFLSSRSLANAGCWIPGAAAADTKFFLDGNPSPVLRAGVGGGLVVVCADPSCRRPIERTPIITYMVPGSIWFGLDFRVSPLPPICHGGKIEQLLVLMQLHQQHAACTHATHASSIRRILRVHNGMAVSAVLVQNIEILILRVLAVSYPAVHKSKYCERTKYPLGSTSISIFSRKYFICVRILPGTSSPRSIIHIPQYTRTYIPRYFSLGNTLFAYSQVLRVGASVQRLLCIPLCPEI